MNVTARTFFSVSAFLLAFGLWNAEQQFSQQDQINQEQIHGHRQFNR